MPRPIPKCPECGVSIHKEQLKTISPLTCPGCRCSLSLSRRYMRVPGAISLVMSIAVCYAVGLSGLLLLVISFVTSFPS